jgi:hypothetical protein
MLARRRGVVLVLVAAALVGCRDDRPGGHAEVGSDGGDARDSRTDLGADHAADGAGDAAPDMAAEAGEGGDARDVAPDRAPDAVWDPDVRPDGDAADQHTATDTGADVAERAPDGPADAPAERPSATASWTIRPNAACVAAGAGCMDTGSVGGYQITATGYCPTTSSVQIYLPGGAGAPAPGTYAVKSASGIFDVIAMPPGMAGLAVDIDDPGKGHLRYWGRSGSVVVAVAAAGGAARHVTFAAVTAREEQSNAAVLLDADVSCP